VGGDRDLRKRKRPTPAENGCIPLDEGRVPIDQFGREEKKEYPSKGGTCRRKGISDKPSPRRPCGYKEKGPSRWRKKGISPSHCQPVYPHLGREIGEEIIWKRKEGNELRNISGALKARPRWSVPRQKKLSPVYRRKGGSPMRKKSFEE